MRAGTRIRSMAVELPSQVWEASEGILPGLRGSQLERLTGIARRRECEPGESSLSLAVAAGRRCLRQFDCDPESVDRVIYAGISRFVDGPDVFRLTASFARSVARELGCGGAQTNDLTNACAGMMTAWYMTELGHRARASRDARGRERTLIVSGEYLTPIARNAARVVDGWAHPELASLTVGDAGAALLIDSEVGSDPSGPAGFRAAHFETLSEHAELCIGGPHPTHAGGRMTTDAAAIHLQAIRALPRVTERALALAGLRYAEIAHVVPHQTSARAIQACRRSFATHFGDDVPSWLLCLAETGNTGSTSHCLALSRAGKREELKDGDHLLFIAGASGLVVGSLVYTWDGSSLVGDSGCPSHAEAS